MDRMDDYSFEMSAGEQDEPYRSPGSTSGNQNTPGRSSLRNQSATRLTPPSSEVSDRVSRTKRRYTPRQPSLTKPREERTFELDFGESSSAPAQFRTVVVEGTIVPLQRTLATPAIPPAIPFIRLDHPDASTMCRVQCPGASYIDTMTENGDGQADLDTEAKSMGTFQWMCQGRPVPVLGGSIIGSVSAIIQRTRIGLRMALKVPCSSIMLEVGFMVPAYNVRIVKAALGGVALPRASGRTGNGTEVRIDTKDRNGTLEIVLEVEDLDEAGGVIPLPVFEFEGDGELVVELRGDLSSKYPACRRSLTALIMLRYPARSIQGQFPPSNSGKHVHIPHFCFIAHSQSIFQ